MIQAFEKIDPKMAGTFQSEPGAGTSTSRWKEHLFFIHDQLACAREEDPPENAVVVFLAPVEVEIRTQVCRIP